MVTFHLIRHIPGAPGLRWFGLGPRLLPSRGLLKLKNLLQKHAFWAQNRSIPELKELLAESTVVISLWRGKRMVGFGRATSDGIYRAVIWDVVVAGDLQGRGLGRKVMDALLSSPKIRNVERVYLMTSKGSNFYKQLGFKTVEKQELLILKKPLS